MIINGSIHNAQSVTDISDKIPLLCNSSSSPPKCGSSGETDKDICSTHLGDNWEETQDKNGNSRCYCKIPYENRLEIDDGGKKRKACVYDTTACDLFSTDPSCKITNVYKCLNGLNKMINGMRKVLDYGIWHLLIILENLILKLEMFK